MKALAVVAVGLAMYAAYAFGQGVPAARQTGGYAVQISGDGRVAWRIDTSTGAVSRCMAGDGSGSCQPWIK